MKSSVKIRKTTFSEPHLADRWNGIVDAAPAATFFQRFEWNYLWWEHIGSKDPMHELLLLVAEDGEDIRAIFPSYIRTRRIGPFKAWSHIHLLGDMLTPFQQAICAPDDSTAVVNALEQYLQNSWRNSWCEFHDVRDDSTLRPFIQHDERGVLSAGEHYLVCDVDSMREKNYNSGLSKSHRSWRNDPDYSYEFCFGNDASLLERMIQLNQQRFGYSSFFADTDSRSFFEALTAACASDTWWSVISYSGNAESILMGFRHRNELYHFLSGTDDDFHDKNMRLGRMNFSKLFSALQQEGTGRFHFLRGDEGYKHSYNPRVIDSTKAHRHCTAPGWRYSLAMKLRAMQGGE
ncbi:MAG: hypothetical protein CL946_09575 [Ectothiorhodospiraceae bacterium]|nr:hypothetical protein [Ectothiorhodospiraceae bacterium]